MKGKRSTAWIKQSHPWTCALVTALNAAAWWGMPKIPSQQSKAWQRWITRCGARHGGATQPELLHRHLGLAAIRLLPEAWAIEDCLKEGIPVEASIWVPRLGLHAVLLLPDSATAGHGPPHVLGMIRERGSSGHIFGRGTKRRVRRAYVKVTMPVGTLLDRHCFPLGNPNRRFLAMVPRRVIA